MILTHLIFLNFFNFFILFFWIYLHFLLFYIYFIILLLILLFHFLRLFLEGAKYIDISLRWKFILNYQYKISCKLSIFGIIYINCKELRIIVFLIFNSEINKSNLPFLYVFLFIPFCDRLFNFHFNLIDDMIAQLEIFIHYMNKRKIIIDFFNEKLD